MFRTSFHKFEGGICEDLTDSDLVVAARTKRSTSAWSVHGLKNPGFIPRAIIVGQILHVAEGDPFIECKSIDPGRIRASLKLIPSNTYSGRGMSGLFCNTPETELTHKRGDVRGIKIQAWILRIESLSRDLELGEIPRGVEACKQARIGGARRSQAVGSVGGIFGDDIDGRIGGIIVSEKPLAKVPGGLNHTLVIAGKDGNDRFTIPKMPISSTILRAMSEGV